MQWPKHTIYWTICSVFTIGLLVGSLLSTKGFEPREEFELFTAYEKVKTLLAIGAFTVAVYLAGTEFHELKRKIKSKD